MSAGIIKLDSQKRVSLGKFTDLEPGAYLHVERDGAVITLKPLHLQPAEIVPHDALGAVA
jgi:hypothetical protein